MTDDTTPEPPRPGPPNLKPKVPPDTLELRARPQPVTRINRRILIGGAAILLLIIAGLVLLALRPLSLRTPNPTKREPSIGSTPQPLHLPPDSRRRS